MNVIKKISISLRFLGLTKTLRTIGSTLQRDYLEWRYPHPPAQDKTYPPGPLRKASMTAQGGSFEFTNAELKVTFLKNDLVRLTWHPGQETPAYAIHKTQWPDLSITSEQTPQGGYAISSSKLKITISTYGAITIHDDQEQLLRRESPPRRQGSHWIHRVHLEEDETIHGLGEKAGPLNLREAQNNGKQATYEFRNQDIGGFYSSGDDPLYMSIPFYLSKKPPRSHAIFYENPYLGTISFDAPHQKDHPQIRVQFNGGKLRYYLAAGPAPHALALYTQLTGRSPMPPKWALGYHQCRWGYRSARDVQDVVQGFKEHDMPLSALHLDIDYMEGFRVFTINKQRFPDLRGLTASLRDQGIHLVSILDPCVKKDKDYFLYQEGKEKQAFCTLPNGRLSTGQVWPGTSVFPDFTHPRVRTWWGEKYTNLIQEGIRGFWHDMNEPAAFKAWGEPTLPRPTRYHLEGAGGDHTQVNNLYGLLMNQAGFQGLKDNQPQQRPWILSRSGWAGNQRYAWNWTGDVSSSWQALRQTLITMLHISLSGIPYTGSDIGGFEGHPSPELFTRWFQLSALTPFFRGHSATGTPRREPWVFGEPYTSINRRFLELRYQLLPYLYSLAWEAHTTGHPIMRPLFWIDESDPSLAGVDNQFLLGDQLLVAPILEKEQQERTVVLPPGAWYSYWDDDVIMGPTTIQRPAALERIPLFIREGSTLPLSQEEGLALHVYPPHKASSFTHTSVLYQDEGDGYGPHRTDHFSLKRKKKALQLAWDDKGKYPFPFQSITLHIHGMDFTQRAVIDDEEFEIQAQKLEVKPFENAHFPHINQGEG